VRRIGPVEQVSSVASLPVTVLRNDRVDRNATGGITVKAARPNLLPVLRGSVAQGRFLNAATERYPVVVLGSVAAERLGIATLRPQTAIDVGGSRFTVVGILDTLPLAPDIDRSALIGYPQAQAAFPPSSYPSDGGVSPSVVYARTDPESVQPVHDVLAATANPEHPEEVQVSQPSDALTARAAAKSAFNSLFLGLGAVALLVGGVGVANVMVMSVLERRSKIGWTKRSTGSSPRSREPVTASTPSPGSASGRPSASSPRPDRHAGVPHRRPPRLVAAHDDARRTRAGAPSRPPRRPPNACDRAQDRRAARHRRERAPSPPATCQPHSRGAHRWHPRSP